MTNDDFRDDSSVYSDEEYQELGGYGKSIYSSDNDDDDYNNENKNTIKLKQSPALKQSGLVKKSIYYIDTNELKISLNHNADSDIIFTIDRKKWQKNLDTIAKMAEERGITEKKDILLLKNHLNDNHKTILFSTTTRTNNHGNEQQQQQELTTIEMPFSEWSIKLVEKYQIFKEKY